MANEIGSTLLNSLTKSTFDIGNMATVLAESGVAGPRAIVERGQVKATTELDALGFLEQNLTAFNSYLSDLSGPSLFQSREATSSNDSIISVTASEGTAQGVYSVESKQLAQSHTMVVNKSYGSPYDNISNGTLSIDVAGQTHNIVVDATNDTLEGLQKFINNGDFGVTASVVNNGGAYQMMFTSSQSGASGEIAVSGLADFDGAGLTTTAEAQDAVMVINGLEISNNSNTFDEVIDGLSFQLNSVAVGQTNSINVANDSETVVDTVKSLVDVYNQLNTIFDEMGSYDSGDLTTEELASEEYKFYGDLAGNNILRQVRSDLRQAFSGSVSNVSSNYDSLGVVGLSISYEGVMELDETKFRQVATTNMDALSSLFSKSGTADDTLINVLGGNENTQTGQYAINITQLAERATITADGAATVTTDEQVEGARVTNGTSAVVLDSSAFLDISLNGGASQLVDLSALANTYNTKDDMVAAIQTEIDAVFGVNQMSINYDVSQSRFEIAADAGRGSVDIVAVGNMDNQGFTTGNTYAGIGLIDLSAADSTFDVKVDDSITSSVTVQMGRYTLDELASKMTSSINSNSDVQASGNSVSVSSDGSALTIASRRFGGVSAVELTNFSASFANSGFTTDQLDTGLSVDGTITTASGVLNLGAYASSEDGRKINISDYAVINGEDAEVRGLQLEILGGVLGARGNVNFTQGFASKAEESILNLFDEDTGLLVRRMDYLNVRLDEYDEKTTKLDVRYEKLELKYRLQFSMLQSLMSSSEATRNQLSAQFSNNN